MVEETLLMWLVDQNLNGRLISGPVQRAYATRIVSLATNNLQSDRQIDLKFPNGWYTHFTERHNLRGRYVQGECGRSDQEAIARTIPELLAEVYKYSADDVWNRDEFGLFYRQASKWTISSAAVEGRKVEKSRITCRTC